jgi:hypothetical protein
MHGLRLWLVDMLEYSGDDVQRPATTGEGGHRNASLVTSKNWSCGIFPFKALGSNTVQLRCLSLQRFYTSHTRLRRVAMSALSTELCCRPDELGSRSLVDNLIEIQKTYAETNKKSIRWVNNLKCLSVAHGRSNTLREKVIEPRDMNVVRNYIAVSYSCKPMVEYESATKEPPGYKIVTKDGSERRNTVRNLVISRVLRYAGYAESSLFWIDQECVNQKSRREKQMAMDSMDRVYNGSRYPVGLLSTIICFESHVGSLASLLGGELVKYSRRDDCSVLVEYDKEEASAVLDVLELLRKDRWWQRAWIFQEEYLGGQRMELLIRHTQELEAVKRKTFATIMSKRNDHRCGKFIDGEICILASQFRQQATRFILALRDDRRTSPVMLKRCDPLLECFGKYNVLYRETEAEGSAMSWMIFSGIAARRVDRQYDILPIAANSCDYAVRLDSQALADKKNRPHSVGLCALAMYLLNGELIHNGKASSESPTTVTTSEYLKDISFRKFDPPVGSGQLTWLKSCRLSDVVLRHDGIHTEGHVWEVYDHFRIVNWRDAKSMPMKPFESGLEPHERDRLYQFAERLRRAESNGKNMTRDSQLPNLIERYLKNDFTSPESTESKDYMDTMAGEIVRAIDDDEEQTLSLAVLAGCNKAFAVFVGALRVNTRIFTSWSSGVDDDKRERKRHVSLQVTLVNSGTPPVMRCTGWINGLTFWQGHRQKEAIFCWPFRWKEVSRKRKRGAEE